MIKKYFSFFFAIFFIFVFLGTICAETSISKFNVKYDSDAIKTMNNLTLAIDLLNQVNFSILAVSDDEVWLNIIVRFKDSSDIEIIGTKEEKIKLLKQKEEWFVPKIDEVLSSLSKNEFKLQHKLSNGFTGWITLSGYNKLISNSLIKKIDWPQIGAKAMLDESVSLIGANDVWSLGYTGDGIDVCVIDTGVDTDHSYLSGKIIDEKCYCDDALFSGCCPDNTDEDDSAEDDNGHGTHVIGIIASQNSTYKGVAYDSDIYVVKVLDNNGDFWSWGDIASAIDWCRTNAGVDVISMSFGTIPVYTDATCLDYVDDEINDAYSSGIPVIISSGNTYSENGISYPACSPNAISVGATTKQDDIASYSNVGPNLDLLSPGSSITSTYIGGGFTSISGTSMATPHVSGAAAILLEYNSSLSPDEILSILQNTGKNVGGWRRINVSAAIDSLCECSSWTANSCGGGTCESNERNYTRICVDDCASESKCESDVSCSGSGVTSCTTSSCDAGYTDQGISSYLVDNKYWTWERTCYKQELSEWILYSSDTETGAGWKSDGVVNCDPMVVAVPTSDYEELLIDSYIGYSSSSGELNRVKWHVVPEGASSATSACSSHTSSYSPAFYVTGCGSSCTVESYVELFQGTSNCNNLCGGSCDDINYWISCSADLYYNEYEDVYDNQYCDVPYTLSVDIDGIIYGDNNADCDVEVQGSESNPDMIQVKWYVNGDRVETQYCDDGSSYSQCYDYSGSTWANLFDLDDSEYSKGDEIYCIARGYGEDGGHGAYVESSITTVSNRIPTWSSVELNETSVAGGVPIKITANSEADLDNDILAMYCCNGSSCTPSISNHDFCYAVGDSYPYDLQCVGQSDEIDGEKTIRCRIYDGDDYSNIQSDTYVVNNSLADNPPNTTLISPANNSTDTYGNIIFNCSATDDKNLVNMTLYGNWSSGWHANETKFLIGISNSTTFTKNLPNGFYKWNCLSYDNSSQSDWANANWTIKVDITIPPNDTNKLYIRNSSNNPVAWLGDEGNIVLKGKCFSGGNCNSPGDGSFIIRNSTNQSIAFINSTGDLCIKTGDCSDENATCNPVKDAFIIRNMTNYNVSYIDSDGDLCLIGRLYENSNP